MASSMITGEQRWASKRRSGMTVLGKVAKVAVPKPLNLPSQRLENHGLDPNVEIVPKGTLSWGSRPSSACSNAWATSAISLSTDGGSSSPSQLVGHPLSGSGTRPSTAGSEKAHDSNVNTRGPNSRPSSASGYLGSNNASLTSLRPHSAETRPGSSQLSRFAEPSPEGSVPWRATPSSERMGVSDGFSLSSGDFPTLGSEKDECRRDVETLDASHGRPGSSSGGVKPLSDSMQITHDNGRDSDIKDHSWRKDCPPFVKDCPRPIMERWHGDPHLYPNPNNVPPHFDSWCGPPPGGVWYRGPPGPPPYRGPVPPGGFHMDPFPYCHPQGPASGAGHHGHHPKNGDMYRPHLPESFMRPGVPMRPGCYPPPVPYEGYYRPPMGPPMGYGNPNERDFPFMGMPAGPLIYNRPINQNAPALNSSHPRSREGKGPDRNDHGLLHNPRENHNDRWNQSDEGKWVHRLNTDRFNHEKGILSKPTLQDNARGDNVGETAAKHEGPSRPRDNRFHLSNPANSMLSGSVSNVQECDTGHAPENLASSKDHSLIQKIEGLNAKARSSGGSRDSFHREELSERVQVGNAWAPQSAGEAASEVVLEKHNPTEVLVPVSHDINVVASEKSRGAVLTTVPRRAVQGAQNRGNRHGKNFDGQEASGWGRKSQAHAAQSDGSNLSTSEQQVDHNSALQQSEVRKGTIEMNSDGESAVSGFVRSDTQRAKMREIAKQRAIELQKEEEERIREQKAKALAKLEELNKRSDSQGAEVPSQTENGPSHSTGPLKPDNSRDQPDTGANSNAESSSVIPFKIGQINVNDSDKVVDSAAGVVTVPQVHDVSKNMRTDYKLTQDVPPEKNLSQVSIIVGQIDVLKDHRREYANEKITVGSKVDGGSRKELLETPLVSDTPAPHKSSSSKSRKNKDKVEGSSDAAVSSNNSEFGQAVSASREDSVKELSQASGDHSLVFREDVHGRANNSRKAQHSHKPRSSQGNRVSEKSQSNDVTVWAPVRSRRKVENPDRTSQNAAEPVVFSVVGENMPQGGSKTKRAEMERYVPKPVAKELAQQGSAQQSQPFSGDHPPAAQALQNSSSGTGGREQAFKGSDSVAKTGVVEGKNRHARGQGSWSQRVSAESNAAQASRNSSVDGTRKDIQPSTEPSMIGSEASVADGWNTVNEPSSKSSFAAFTGVKVQLPSGREKSHHFKGKKSSGNSHSFDHKVPNANEINYTEKTVSSKENRAVVDHSTLHWQPKSQVYGANDQQGNRSHGGQNHIAQDSKGLKPVIGSGSGVHFQSQYNQSEDKGEDRATQDIGDEETKRKNRGPQVKGHPHPSTQALEPDVEPASSGGADRRNEQRPSSGYRKYSNYGGRVGRVHESRGDWSTTAAESRQHYTSANPERQRHNSHYEYQPVGAYNDDSGSQMENQHGGPRSRGRGHARRGRGNFHEWQSGTE